MRSSGGVSGLIINSNNGNRAFSLIKDQIEYEEYDIGLALKHNGQLSKPNTKPALRDEIIKTYIDQGFGVAARRYMRPKHAAAYKVYFTLPLRLRKTIGTLKKAILRHK